jgi:group I intron endonuclease
MSEKCGVYEIKCLTNGRSYIGSSIDTVRRFKAHRWALARGAHANKKLQAAWNKYGADQFRFSVLISCQPDLQLFFEQRVIDALRTVEAGFNLARSVSAPMLGLAHTEEARRKLSSANSGKVFSESTLAALRKAAQKRSALVSLQMVEMWKSRPRSVIDQIAASNRGKKRSVEACANIGAATKLKWARPGFRDARLKDLEKARQAAKAPAVRAKMSERMKERMANPNEKAKLSKVHRGRENSPETIEKMRQAALGRSPETREKYRIAALAREAKKRKAKESNDPD